MSKIRIAFMGCLILLLTSGCDLIDPLVSFYKDAFSKVETPPLYKYKADIQITVDGITFDGLAVAQINDKKDIHIVSKARLYVLTISTCSRHFSIERADKNWFGGVGKSFTYTFQPNEVEKSEICPMYIEAVDLNGTASWGMVHFRTNESLPALVSCNGNTRTFNGLSLCQTKHSLIQNIEFKKLITQFLASENCNVKQLNEFEFEIRPNVGFCFMTFMSGVDIHRTTFLGFERVFVRGD